MSDRNRKLAWAAMWYEFDGPIVHTVRDTRREVAAHMAETWGSWARAYKRGCRIVRVRVEIASPTPPGGSDE